MKLSAFNILLIISLLLGIQVTAQNNKVRINNIPNWVTQTAVNYANNSLDADAQDGYVDLDFETQVSLQDGITFYKRAIKIISEAGVQNKSDIEVTYDPAYEQVVFHSVRIIRGNSTINKLQLSKIKTSQQETEQDRFIYNGTLAVVIHLEDVRKGDVIEYQFSIVGENPIFKGKFARVFDTKFSVPVYQLYYKIIAAGSTKLKYKSSNNEIVPQVSSTGLQTIYECKLSNISPLYVQDELPDWYNPYSTIMFSEYENWGQVKDWAKQLYPSNIELTASLKNKVNEIKSKSPVIETQILSALRFVQDEVRYLGMEMGISAYQPHSPNQILAQRFGDCKDKSYLLYTMLRALGVSASPVLINTSDKSSIKAGLPSPSVFDHVVIMVSYQNKTYWLDPTISFQRGPLESISFPDYQVGLVLFDPAPQLTSIPANQKGKMKVKEVFDIANMQGKAKLKVVTQYSGVYADNVRSDFHNNSHYSMKKTYLDFYGYYFKNISADSLITVDNEASGDFTTTEYYSIDSLWGNYSTMQKALFPAFIISGQIKRPKDEKRTMPFKINFPSNYEEEIEVNLPEIWPIKETSENVVCPAFNYYTKYHSIGKKVIINYNYQTLKDHVLQEEAEEYYSKIKQAEDNISYELTYTMMGGEVPSSFINSWSDNYNLLYVVLGLAALITYLVKNRA